MFLFLSCGGVYRCLHSFPTRRSSDLLHRNFQWVWVYAAHALLIFGFGCLAGWMMTGRSEEHTSELQSPCNIVCRLLLEKKKNNQSKNIKRLNETDTERRIAEDDRSAI